MFLQHLIDSGLLHAFAQPCLIGSQHSLVHASEQASGWQSPYHADGLQRALEVVLNGGRQVDGVVCNGLPLVADAAHLYATRDVQLRLPTTGPFSYGNGANIFLTTV